MTDLEQIIAEISLSADSVEALRHLVLAHDGFWSDQTPQSGIFEIQMAELVGIGPCPAAAADDWIAQAKARLENRPRALR